MTRSEQISYAAGFFDGEGHIRIQSHSKRGSYMLQISAVQATIRPLPLFVELFGGTLKPRKLKYKSGFRAQYTWQASSKVAEMALKEMLPFLIVKRDEAELALCFRKTFRPQYGERSKNTPELEASRKEAMQLLKRLRIEKRESAFADVMREFETH